MDFSIAEMWMNGQHDHVLTDEETPEVELRVTGGAPEGIRAALATASGQPVWDSGMTPYTGPFLTLPAVLKPRTDYVLSVTAEWPGGTDTKELTFHTGFMGETWAGEWIEPEQENALPEEPMAFWQNFIPRPIPPAEEDGGRLRCGQTLRRTFALEERPVRAVLYATARGVYTPYLNGRRVGNARLAPEITPYETLLYYQRYDLTPYLREGENQLLVELGDGWYAGRIGLSGSSCQYGNRLSFLGQLELDYKDGRREVIGTDGRFESRRSQIAYSDLFIGEKWDLLRELGEWTSCRTVEAPSARLEAQPMPAITSGAPISGRLLDQEDGGLLVDFRQNLAGVVRLSFRTEEPAAVVVEHTEALDPSGHFFRNIVGRNKQQRDQLVCGPGKHCFEPLHTYHGFRYARISGITRQQLQEVQAIPVTTSVAETGSFRCSSQELNQLQHNIRWSMRSNFISIPTDCPQREKMGWTGDILAFAATGCFNAQLLPILSAWLGQMRLEQREDGEVPNIVPAFPIDDAMARDFWGDDTSSAWGDACIMVPLQLYRATGNRRVLADNLPMMERWLEYVCRSAASEGDPLLWTSGHHFGDWLIPSMAGDPQRVNEGVERTREVTASAFRAIALDGWRQVLEALLERENTPRLRQLREEAVRLLAQVRQAVREAYVSPEGQVKGDLQGLYVIVLRAGAVEGPLRQKVADRLARMIRDNGCRLDTGFVSTPYLLDVLTETGHKDLAWELLFQTKAPSWLGQVKRGATTIWENWTAVQEDGTPTDSSMNHYALGAVGDWIYRNVGGIQSEGPGWSRVRFAPDFSCGLTWSQCEKLTPRGRVFCRWERNGQEVRVRLETPVPSRWCEGGEQRELPPGEHTFTVVLAQWGQGERLRA